MSKIKGGGTSERNRPINLIDFERPNAMFLNLVF